MAGGFWLSPAAKSLSADAILRRQEPNDNSVDLLLIYGTAHVLLAGEAEVGRSSDEKFVHEAPHGHQRLETTHTL
jgi:hypothetical protein